MNTTELALIAFVVIRELIHYWQWVDSEERVARSVQQADRSHEANLTRCFATWSDAVKHGNEDAHGIHDRKENP